MCDGHYTMGAAPDDGSGAELAVNNEHHRKTVAIGYHREPLLRILLISQSNQSSNQFY